MDAIVTHGLTKRFGDLLALDGLDLQVPSGGVVGFVGPNGSGTVQLWRELAAGGTPGISFESALQLGAAYLTGGILIAVAVSHFREITY